MSCFDRFTKLKRNEALESEKNSYYSYENIYFYHHYYSLYGEKCPYYTPWSKFSILPKIMPA